ncbi:transposase [Candidatus Symbiobacter mobilis CR]|uniref:Transposase n=2 Tax=Candidatus Symbiobacter TaxID=1436289 RepID=U5N7T8_9BURK|nr:transposase [Candidatus Symbiobacter mobilis CR]
MYALLDLYARPMSVAQPVICIDEKSLQLIADSRKRLPMAPKSPVKQDYEYVRNGTTNLFVAVDPKAGKLASSLASVWIDASPIAMPCKPKSMPGNKRETHSNAPSSGISLDKMQLASSDIIMFHNLRVAVLVVVVVRVLEHHFASHPQPTGGIVIHDTVPGSTRPQDVAGLLPFSTHP